MEKVRILSFLVALIGITCPVFVKSQDVPLNYKKYKKVKWEQFARNISREDVKELNIEFSVGCPGNLDRVLIRDVESKMSLTIDREAPYAVIVSCARFSGYGFDNRTGNALSVSFLNFKAYMVDKDRKTRTDLAKEEQLQGPITSGTTPESLSSDERSVQYISRRIIEALRTKLGQLR